MLTMHLCCPTVNFLHLIISPYRFKEFTERWKKKIITEETPITSRLWDTTWFAVWHYFSAEHWLLKWAGHGMNSEKQGPLPHFNPEIVSFIGIQRNLKTSGRIKFTNLMAWISWARHQISLLFHSSSFPFQFLKKKPKTFDIRQSTNPWHPLCDYFYLYIRICCSEYQNLIGAGV